MMKFSRLAMGVAALASMSAVLSSTASAVTFTNSGGTVFHATAGEGTVAVTGAAGSNNLTCADATATGTVASGTFTQVDGTATFTGCTMIGLHTEWTCSYVLVPTVFDGGTPAVTTGNVTVTCVERLATTPFTALCNINGSTPVSYTNPTGATPGRFTLTASNLLTISNASDASCSSVGVPTGTTRPGDLSEQTFTLTSAAQSPIISSP